jgi:hypothetical protein
VIGRNLRTLTNTQCIQTTHYVQDGKHQYEAIEENNNEYAKDHSFKPTCIHFLRNESNKNINTCPSRGITYYAHRRNLISKASPVYFVGEGGE